ncbi:MAG: hypothetical protein FJ290_19800 [Planctomycetes bacterium]|nr:hypothetical protein [Planctomycetota bacterium]
MNARGLMSMIVLAACAGCAGLGKYAKDRGNDFRDCFTALGGFGMLGPAFEVHATRWLTTGAGWTIVPGKWGIEGREVVERNYIHAGFGILPFMLFNPDPRKENDIEKDGALKNFYTYTSTCNEGTWDLWGRTERVRVTKSIVLFDVTSIPRFAYHKYGSSAPSPNQVKRRAIEALDVHVDVTAALLLGPSVRLGFSPGQFADFVLGFFGLDIAGDDTKPQPPKTKEGDKR